MFAGVFIKEHVFVGNIDLNITTLYSVTLPIANRDYDFPKLGFAKQSNGQSLAEILFGEREIAQPVATFVPKPVVYKSLLILGNFHRNLIVQCNLPKPDTFSNGTVFKGFF